MLKNKILYFKKIYNFGADHVFTGVISSRGFVESSTPPPPPPPQ